MTVSPLVILLAFVTVVSALAGIYSLLSDLWLRERDRVDERLNEEFRVRRREQARKASVFKDLGRVAAEAAEDDARPGLRGWFERLLEQSGLNLTPRRLLGYSGLAGLGLGLPAGVLGRGPVAAVVAALAGSLVPTLYVHLRRQARLERMLGQLPDVFETMARVLRAGQSLTQALLAVADGFKPPIAAEFAACHDQHSLGLPLETALRDVGRRTGLLELKIFALAVTVQEESGGNLAELLDKLATVVRERFRMRGKIRVLTAESRMQAAVLLGLPVVLFVMMLFLKRSYVAALFAHPGLILAVLVSQALGALWIHRIVHFDF